MKIWHKILVFVVVVIIAVYALYPYNHTDKTTVTVAKTTNLSTIGASLQHKVDSLKQLIELKEYQCKIDSLEAVLRESCQAKTSSVAAEVKTTAKKNKAIKTVKQKNGQKKTAAVNQKTDITKKSAFKPELKTKAIKTDTAEKAAVQTKKQFQTTLEYETDLQSGIQYVGGTDGDFYTTVSYDGYLQYVISKKLYDDAGGTAVPELNYKGSGKKFSYDPDENAYYYTDMSVPIDEASANGTYHWAVYIGEKDGFSAYLPHEVLKDAIIKVRGDLAGTISKADVDGIGKIIPEVQKERIQPNKITAAGDYDGKKYEGWRFSTKVLYTKVQN